MNIIKRVQVKFQKYGIKYEGEASWLAGNNNANKR
jgi:hypothetical protein